MRFKLADLVRLGRVSLPGDDVLREKLAFCRYDYDSTLLQLIHTFNQITIKNTIRIKREWKLS